MKNNLENNTIIKTFIEEQGEYISKNIEGNLNNKESSANMQNERIEDKRKIVQEYRKEGHIYLVTEDRGKKIYLWDYTDKPDFEIEEFELPKEILEVAHEGAMLKYENGKYTLYSKKGYDKLFEDKRN